MAHRRGAGWRQQSHAGHGPRMGGGRCTGRMAERLRATQCHPDRTDRRGLCPDPDVLRGSSVTTSPAQRSGAALTACLYKQAPAIAIMSKTVRWGFVGAGWMARAMAADLAALPGCQVHSVTARSHQSAEDFGRQVEAKVASSLESLLADDEVDLVYITSPNNLHFSQAKLALEAGKRVLGEKPFALNAAQLADLVDLARARGLFLMEAMWVRFLPAVVRLRSLLAEGRIGDLTWLHASFHSKPPREPGNRFYDLGMGGGALLDLGVYPISFASMA